MTCRGDYLRSDITIMFIRSNLSVLKGTLPLYFYSLLYIYIHRWSLTYIHYLNFMAQCDSDAHSVPILGYIKSMHHNLYCKFIYRINFYSFIYLFSNNSCYLFLASYSHSTYNISTYGGFIKINPII